MAFSNESLQLLRRANCCITGRRLNSLGELNVIQLHFTPEWKYPLWKDFVNDQDGRDNAVAVVAMDCITPDGILIGLVKHAVEIDGDTIIYHPVNIYVMRFFADHYRMGKNRQN